MIQIKKSREDRRIERVEKEEKKWEEIREEQRRNAEALKWIDDKWRNCRNFEVANHGDNRKYFEQTLSQDQ